MAVLAWTDVGVLVDDFELSTVAKNFEAPTTEVEVLDTTPLGSSGWRTHIPGLKMASWSAEVMQDHAADGVDDRLGIAALGSRYPVSVVPEGFTTGNVAYTFRANVFTYTPVAAAVDGLAMARMGGSGSGVPAVRGTLMVSPSAAITSSGDGTAYQVGAVSSTQNMYVALHVTAVSGTSPTLDIDIESDDNSGMTSATTQGSLTQATAVGSQWSSISGPVTDDWWRISYTLGGTSPSFTFAVVIGVATP